MREGLTLWLAFILKLAALVGSHLVKLYLSADIAFNVLEPLSLTVVGVLRFNN